MCLTSLIPIWFVCKSCSINFQNLNDFIKHKNDEHLQELLQNKCIVFEERTLDGVAIAEISIYRAAESDQGNDATHVLTVKEKIENATNSDPCIESFRSEQIPNSQLIIKSESQSNLNDPNDEPAAVNNILGIDSNSHFELSQDSNLNQNPNCNFSEDVKPNPEDLINTNLELKYQVYEVENEETQSENIRKKPTQNPSVYLKRLSEQEIQSASSVHVKGNPNKYRRPRKMCSVCSQSFADRRRLREHFERVHKLPLPLPLPNEYPLPKTLACKICEKKFNRSSDLRRHFRTLHKTEHLEYRRQPSKFKPNAQVCTICHRQYVTSSTLNRHIQLKHAKNNKNDDELARVTVSEERDRINDVLEKYKFLKPRDPPVICLLIL